MAAQASRASKAETVTPQAAATPTTATADPKTGSPG